LPRREKTEDRSKGKYDVWCTSKGFISALDDVVEMAIPVAAIGKGDFQILPIIRHDVKKINYDEWGTWIRVKVG
jgi:hypothetical protein